MKKLILIMFFPSALFAGQIISHDVSVHGGFGISTLKYSNNKNGFGGTIGFGNACNFNNRWAIFSGLELAFYKASTNINTLNYIHTIHVPAYAPFGDDRFDYAVETNGFSEKETTRYLNIPLMVRYKYEVDFFQAFYAMAGLKFGIPIGGSYTEKIDQFTTAGYSYASHQSHTNEPEYGFSTYTDYEHNDRLNLKCNITLSLEIGSDWTIDLYKRFYAGIFFDYGLMNLSNQTQAHPISYNPMDVATPKPSSITGMFGKIHTTTIGIILRFGLNFEKMP